MLVHVIILFCLIRIVGGLILAGVEAGSLNRGRRWNAQQNAAIHKREAELRAEADAHYVERDRRNAEYWAKDEKGLAAWYKFRDENYDLCGPPYGQHWHTVDGYAFSPLCGRELA